MLRMNGEGDHFHILLRLWWGCGIIMYISIILFKIPLGTKTTLTLSLSLSLFVSLLRYVFCLFQEYITFIEWNRWFHKFWYVSVALLINILNNICLIECSKSLHRDRQMPELSEKKKKKKKKKTLDLPIARRRFPRRLFCFGSLVILDVARFCL